MKPAPPKSHWIIKIMIFVVVAIFMGFMIDFVRCKAKKDGCTVAWWRFNKPKDCKANTDCTSPMTCQSGVCKSPKTCAANSDCTPPMTCQSGVCKGVSVVRRSFKNKNRKYRLSYEVPPVPPPAPAPEPVPQPSVSGYAKMYPHKRLM